MPTPFHRSRPPVDPAIVQAQAEARKRRRIIFGVIGALLLVVGYFVLAAFLPRWWGRQVGRWCDDSFTKGLLYGLAFGLICTFLPLVIAATVFFRRLNNQVRAVILIVAVAVAAPNLLTLGIATGTGSGAHAGDRYLDLGAPFFRGATLIGAIVAVVLFLLSIWQYRAARKVRSLKRQSRAERKQVRAAAEAADAAPAPTAPEPGEATPIVAAPIRRDDPGTGNSAG